MRNIFQKILRYVRKTPSDGGFMSVGEPVLEHTIIYKAANILASEKVEGDYLEFGVFTGRSFIDAYSVMKDVFGPDQKLHGRTKEVQREISRIWDNMRFFAFDSFQGLPELEGVDKESRDFTEGKFKATENAFRKNLAKEGVPSDKVVVVPGLFDDTCTQETIMKHGMKKASIIHVDCDLYHSTTTVLEFVKPLLVDGTIIIFDDWYCFRGNPNLGEQRAFNEWRATMPDWSFTEYQKEGPWRNSFIAHCDLVNEK